jgi:hypothetical protein
MKLRLTDHGLRQLREISRGGNPPMTGLLRQLKLVDAKGKLTPAGKEALGGPVLPHPRIRSRVDGARRT